jgi:hypothetical protein
VTGQQAGSPSALQRAYLAAVAVVAAALCLAETAIHGIGISPDSIDYLLRARQLAEPGGFGALLTPALPASQPPLFPLLLALLERATGADVAACLRYLNAALLAGLVYAAGAGLFVRAGRPIHPLVFGVAPLGLLLSRSLHDVFGMAWSEPLFLFASVLFLVALARYLRQGEPSALAVASLLAIVAVYTRYSGVTLIAAGALAIPFAARRSARDKLCDLLAFGVTTSLALGVWLLRNLHVTGTLSGTREPAMSSLLENIVLAVGIRRRSRPVSSSPAPW